MQMRNPVDVRALRTEWAKFRSICSIEQIMNTE
jgi:hypothetical protein